MIISQEGTESQWRPATGHSAVATEGDGNPLLERLISRCLDGDEAAYLLLYNQFAAPLYRLCYSLLQQQQDAEEVLQDSFEYAFRRLAQFDARQATFKTWLYQIAICRCRNKRRRKWLPTFSLSHLAGADIPDKDSPSPAELLALDGLQRAVWEALAQLSPKLRETAVLRYYDNLTYREIAGVLQIPVKTVESRMRLAHNALRDLLAE